ncbi:hypothetical protein MKW98_001558, partial [Papaver atlanticum]
EKENDLIGFKLGLKVTAMLAEQWRGSVHEYSSSSCDEDGSRSGDEKDSSSSDEDVSSTGNVEDSTGGDKVEEQGNNGDGDTVQNDDNPLDVLP